MLIINKNTTSSGAKYMYKPRAEPAAAAAATDEDACELRRRTSMTTPRIRTRGVASASDFRALSDEHRRLLDGLYDRLAAEISSYTMEHCVVDVNEKGLYDDLVRFVYVAAGSPSPFKR